VHAQETGSHSGRRAEEGRQRRWKCTQLVRSPVTARHTTLRLTGAPLGTPTTPRAPLGIIAPGPAPCGILAPAPAPLGIPPVRSMARFWQG